MTEPRQIAVVRSYDELLAVMRQRVGELGINYAILDDITKFTDTYSTKILGHGGITRSRDGNGKLKRGTQRGLSPQAFDAYVQALCFDLVAVENPERVRKVKAWLAAKLEGREGSIRELPMRRIRLATWLFTPKKSIWLNKMRKDKLSPEQRSESARTAARARWQKPRITEITDKISVNASHATHPNRGALPTSKSSGITRGANKKESPQAPRSEARTVRRR